MKELVIAYTMKIDPKPKEAHLTHLFSCSYYVCSFKMGARSQVVN